MSQTLIFFSAGAVLGMALFVAIGFLAEYLEERKTPESAKLHDGASQYHVIDVLYNNPETYTQPENWRFVNRYLQTSKGVEDCGG